MVLFEWLSEPLAAALAAMKILQVDKEQPGTRFYFHIAVFHASGLFPTGQKLA
jgi:hypothetical protein